MNRWRRLRFDLPARHEDDLGVWLETAGALGSEVQPRPGGRIHVLAYFEESQAHPIPELHRILTARGLALPEIQEDHQEDQGWAESYQESLRPFPIGERFLVVPGPIAPAHPEPGRIELRITPGRAFGTGDHPTTELCVRYLEQQVLPGMHVLDVGTGSGILAIAAVRLGAARVVAVEPDPEAVKVATENLRVNGVEERVHLVQGTTANLASGWFDVLAANILAGTLKELMPELAFLLRPAGRGILSGIQEGEEQEILDAAAGRGLRALAWERRRGWVGVGVQKPTPGEA